MGRETLTGAATRYIAGELRAQKARMGWTLDDIVTRTGVARPTVNRALTGKSAIAIESLIQLCHGMELDVVALITEASNITE